MTNMSYCRFRNTRTDVNDCLTALEDEEINSEEEATAAYRMLKNVLQWARGCEVIESYDDEELKDAVHDAMTYDLKDAFKSDGVDINELLD